jgi:hypothetical protein
MNKKLAWWEKRKQPKGGWTRDAWLAYRDWAERWERWAMNQARVYRIVAEMCERED